MLARIRRLEEPDTLPKIRKEAVAALENLLQRGDLNPEDVTTCLDTDLDSNMLYLGCLNGVIDLRSGKLLNRDEAREALVTLRAPTEFDPKATHRVVDDLFGRMSEDRRRHYLGALGNGLRAIPKRLYAVVCEPDCGKTTHLNLIVNTLGDHYAKVAAPHVIQQRKRSRTSETQLTPGLTAWWLPTRIVLFDEVKESELSPEIVKDLTGGGLLTARKLTQNLKTLRATATTFMFSNEETVPRIGSSADQGLRVRYRELRFPYIPDDERDDGEIRDTMTRDPEVRKAFFALLVRAAAENPTPPDDTPEVRQLTVARTIAEGGELARFSRRIVQDPDSFMALDALWSEWCAENGEPISDKVGGISKRIVARRLAALIEDLPRPKLRANNGSRERGWRGWRLLTGEEVAAMSRTALKEAELAINGAVALSPAFTDEQREWVLETLLEEWGWLKKLNEGYANGYELNRSVAEVIKISRDHGVEESIRKHHHSLTDEQFAAVSRFNAIEILARVSGAIRPRSPVCEQARIRFSKVETHTWNREPVAWSYLNKADQALGPDADAEALVGEAVKLLRDWLVECPEEAELHNVADIEAAMKELVGLQPRVVH